MIQRKQFSRTIFLSIAFFSRTLLGSDIDTPTQSATSCDISGTVSSQNSGEPLSGVTLRLETATSGLESLLEPSYDLFGVRTSAGGYTTASSSDGQFCFRSIKPADYLLSASADGFLPAVYGAMSLSTVGTILTVTGDAIQEAINLRLPTLSTIGGRVVDEGGIGLPDLNVVAVKQQWLQEQQAFIPVQGVRSGASGEYQIGKLTPGVYYVYAQPYPGLPNLVIVHPVEDGKATKQEQLVQTFFPHSLSIANAQAVVAIAGGDAQGINITARKALTFHVRGRVLGQREDWAGGVADLSASAVQRIGLVLGGDSNLEPDGSFDLGDVPAGTYDVTFRSPLSSGNVTVRVTEADLFVSLPIVPNGILKGQIALDKTAAQNVDLSSSKVSLVEADSFLRLTYAARVSQGGAFSAENIPAGKYLLKFTPPLGFYVKAVAAGGIDLTGPNIDMSSGGILTASIQLGSGLGSVSGIINETDALRGPANVVLIATTRSADIPAIYWGSADKDHRFSITKIPPGTYRIVALASVDAHSLQSPAALEGLRRLGQEVRVAENQSSQVEIQLTSVDGLSVSL